MFNYTKQTILLPTGLAAASLLLFMMFASSSDLTRNFLDSFMAEQEIHLQVLHHDTRTEFRVANKHLFFSKTQGQTTFSQGQTIGFVKLNVEKFGIGCHKSLIQYNQMAVMNTLDFYF